ncbi:MAG: hypothetical protein LBG31_04190 [Prevotellaceae bacterium]|nr:hypothetical protein [Prevotellaceae bacterium]
MSPRPAGGKLHHVATVPEALRRTFNTCSNLPGSLQTTCNTCSNRPEGLRHTFSRCCNHYSGDRDGRLSGAMATIRPNCLRFGADFSTPRTHSSCAEPAPSAVEGVEMTALVSRKS